MNAPRDYFAPLDDKGVLRLITAGFVDDGKSTLIGRLLYDSKGVFADQLDAISRARHRRAGGDRMVLPLLPVGWGADGGKAITSTWATGSLPPPTRRSFV